VAGARVAAVVTRVPLRFLAARCRGTFAGMGMYGAVTRASDATLGALIDDPSRYSDFVDREDPHLEERIEGTVSLDKYWHALHFLMCQKAWEVPADGPPELAFLVTGGSPLGHEGEARVFLAAATARIGNALDTLSADTLTARYDRPAMTALDIYPKIWDRDDEADETLESLLETFDDLRELVRAAARAGQGIVVAIS